MNYQQGFCALALMLTMTPALAANKCIEDSGRIFYQESPCPANTRGGDMKLNVNQPVTGQATPAPPVENPAVPASPENSSSLPTPPTSGENPPQDLGSETLQPQTPTPATPAMQQPGQPETRPHRPGTPPPQRDLS